MTTHSRWLRVLALLLGLSLVAAACGDDDDGAAPDDTGSEDADGGTVVFASEQEPGGWNVNTASDGTLSLGQLTEMVFPATFRITPDFEVVLDEDLLDSAEQVSEDPQVIEYVISEDAVWSDGTPITAEDFSLFGELQTGENPDVDVAETTGYDQIESIEGSDDGKTVTVTFGTPYSEWRSLFHDLMPAHVITELGDGDPVAGWNDGFDGEALPEVSGGPYRFADYRPEQSVTLVPNEEWWGEAPNLDEIVVRFDVDPSGIPAALENGEIDLAYPQPQLDLVDQIDAIDGVGSIISLGLQFEHIDFNLNNPHLAKPEVRMAIGKALDRTDLVDRTVGQFTDEASVLNNRLWMNNQPEYEAHGDEYTEQDLDAAADLLDDAGYDCGGDVCTHPDDGDLSLRISTTAGNALRENTQLVIQDHLAEAGIEITIDNLEGAAVFDKFFPQSNAPGDQDYDIALFAWVSSPWTASSKSLYSSGPDAVNFNNTNYANEEVDDLFDQALGATDADEAADLLNQVDTILWEDLPTIPLYQKPTFFPHRESINGIEDNASLAGPLWNAQEWTLEG